jgi:hypothetical protein
VEVPPGPLVALTMDINQRWIADMGLSGPDAAALDGDWKPGDFEKTE